jgi:diaminohydroxyphosphoribosylaminopyrimidine deaminase/5-amino-6-(5-phosphoribosylamino)uracil reductase
LIPFPSLKTGSVFMDLAVEQALRARGSVAPNPLVGAVIERDGVVLATGFHAVYGALHAEASALAACGEQNVRGATMYVTLEPCNHFGRQPPCTHAIVAAGIERVVIGAMDPNPLTAAGGLNALRDAGVAVDVLDAPACRRLIEDFAVWTTVSNRPYLAVKMAASLDGYIAAKSGTRMQLTGEAWSARVRDWRIAHDAVMVGAGTVRVDDPLLTVRPPAERARPYVRVVVCETDSVPASSNVFRAVNGYARTIVLAPAAARERFGNLEGCADVVFVDDDRATSRLHLTTAMQRLRERDIYSVLCEGGPTLAAGLIAAGLVDRVHWGIAPLLLGGPDSVPALGGIRLRNELGIDVTERAGDDVYVSGKVRNV